MDSEIRPVGPDGEGRVILEMAGLRDGIETLERTIGRTVGAGAAITSVFMVGAMFMERGSTLWFLAVMWSVLTLRLVLINRRSRGEKRIKEAALESLENSRHGPALPPEATDRGPPGRER